VSAGGAGSHRATSALILAVLTEIAISQDRGSRVHELAHQSVCVPMPWRKLFAFTSHDISRLQAKMGMRFVHHSSYKAAFRGVALRYITSSISNKPPPRSSNDSPLEEKRPRYTGTKQQAAATSRTWDGQIGDMSAGDRLSGRVCRAVAMGFGAASKGGRTSIGSG
jgi:hypothetical protein